MKRMYKTRFLCHRGYRGATYVAPASEYGSGILVLQKNFRKIFGFAMPRLSKISCDLTVRLIGEPSPWGEWTWEMAVCKPNRFSFEVPLLGDLGGPDGFVYLEEFLPHEGPFEQGRAPLASPCAGTVCKVFPGLIEAVGYGNTCEMEIIAHRIRKRSKR